MSDDTGSATLRANYAGVNVDQIYSIARSRAGANGISGTNGTNGTNGADAKTLIVLSDRQTIAYDASGLPSPTAQTITFTTNKQNTSATVYWSIADAQGTPVSVSYLSAASGDSVTMTEANFAVARNGTSGVIVTGSLTDGTVITDKISVIAVRAGANGTNGVDGANGIDALSLSAAPPSVTVPCTAGGTPKGSLASVQMTVFKGTTNVTGSTTYAISGVSNLSGVSVSSGGLVTVTGITADVGSYVITATKDGASATTKIVYTKARDGAAYVDALLDPVGTPSSTSYANMGQLSLLMGPNGTIDLDTNGGFTGYTSVVNVEGTIDYSLNGGSSWSTALTFTGDPSIDSSSPGGWAASASISGGSIGLSSKQAVLFRLMLRKTNSNGINTFGGSLYVVWRD